MSNENYLSRIYAKIKITEKMHLIGETYIKKNPHYDGWGSAQGSPAVEVVYTKEDLEFHCSQITRNLEEIPDNILSPSLREFKKGNYGTDKDLIKKTLIEELHRLGYPGQIKGLEVVINFISSSSKIQLWPEGLVETRFRGRPYTEFIPRWKYFLNLASDSANIIYELEISSSWEFQDQAMLVSWKLISVDTSKIGMISSKEIFQVSQSDIRNLSDKSQVRVDLNKSEEKSLIKLNYEHKPY